MKCRLSTSATLTALRLAGRISITSWIECWASEPLQILIEMWFGLWWAFNCPSHLTHPLNPLCTIRDPVDHIRQVVPGQAR